MTIGDRGVTEWDFFVSYQQADRAWAEWMAWQLEAAGHSVLFQGWDFVPGANWIKLMQDGVSSSARVIVVLSPAYIDSVFGAAEWQTIWAHDPTGAKRRVIPVRVADCERPGLLAGIVGIDLFGVPEPKALQRLQDAINRALAGRAKPLSPLPSGVFMANDDYNDRMVAIDPATGALVWQYGITGKPGTAPGELNIPDGFDLLLPDGSTPTHAATG